MTIIGFTVTALSFPKIYKKKGLVNSAVRLVPIPWYCHFWLCGPFMDLCDYEHSTKAHIKTAPKPGVLYEFIKK